MRLCRILTLAFIFAVSLFAANLGAANPGFAQEAAGNLEPAIPPAAKGAECIRDTDFMRRNHMMLLKHKRDVTVHDGERTADASLKECITCHAVNGDDGKPVTVADERHFCRSCHDYAAVKVDCFECHASRPEITGAAAMSVPDPHEVSALTDFVKRVSQ